MINFLKYRWLCGLFSLGIMFLFAGLLVYKHIYTGHTFTYSVEFTGGTQILLAFDKKVSANTVVEILAKHGWSGASTRAFPNNEIMIRIKDFSNDTTGLAERIKDVLQKNISDVSSIRILKIDSIGEGIGAALSWNSIKAVVMGLIFMLIYIAWRFWSFAYAAGAITALFHDAIVILLFFLLFDKEISMNVIGAILAVLGYSVNDTIVIFSRIRENFALMRNATPQQVVNISLNQTLKRTMLTSISTGLVVLSMIVLGGEALRDLSLALLVGIIFGTYSSIYIASPVMLSLYNKEH